MQYQVLRLSLMFPAVLCGAGSLSTAMPQVPELLTPSRVQTMGGEADLHDISNDGRFVLFESEQANVIPGQIEAGPPHTIDLFLHDRMSGTTALVTHIGDGVTVAAVRDVRLAGVISGDGSTVAFFSKQTGLVAGFDTQGLRQIYMYDVGTGVISAVSTDASNSALGGNSHPHALAIDADGSTIIYDSRATNLVSGFVDTNGNGYDVFAYDVGSGTTSLVSQSTVGTTTGGNGSSGKEFSETVCISDDGTTVTFESRATDLVSGFTSPATGTAIDVYSHHLGTGTTTLVSHAVGSTTTGADNFIEVFKVSADGQQIAYTTAATNLVAGFVDGTPLYNDLFVHDLASGTTSLVNPSSGSSVTSSGGVHFRGYALSGDGSLVVFQSLGGDHVAGVTDANGLVDVYSYAVAAGTLSLVSHLPSDSMTAAGSHSSLGTVPIFCSSDAGMITFYGDSPNLVAGFVPGTAAEPGNAFVYDAASGTTTLLSHAVGFATTGANQRVRPEAISVDGATVFVDCRASNVTSSLLAARGSLLAIDSGTTANSIVSPLLGTMSSTSNQESELDSDSIVSDDGRYILFDNESSDLIPGLLLHNNGDNLFLVDRSAGTTTLLNDIGDGTTPSLEIPGSGYAISGNGEIVVFRCDSDDLVAGFTGNGEHNLYVYNVATDTLMLGSHDSGNPTVGGNGDTDDKATISGDGAWIAYSSAATNIGAGVTDGNGLRDVFLLEVATGSSTLVSHADVSTSTAANGDSWEPRISADGSTIIFTSESTDLIGGFIDTNGGGVADVYSYDVATGTVTLLSHGAANLLAGGNDLSDRPRVSGTGAIVAFDSEATDLVAGFVDNNGGGSDIFVSSSGLVTLVTHDAGSAVAGGDGYIFQAEISRSGSAIIFSSSSENLIGGFINNNGSDSDVFRYDVATGTLALVSHAFGLPTTTGNSSSSDPRINTRGTRIAFESRATDLASGVLDNDDRADVFLYEVGLDVTILISHVPNQPTIAGNYEDEEVRMNADGTLLAFESSSTDLVDDDLSVEADIFAYEYPLPLVGTSFCDPNNANSTGASTTLSGYMLTRGGIAGGMSDLHLECTNGGASMLGYFLVGDLASDPGIPISDGMLCVASGQIFRYNVAGTTSMSAGFFNANGVLVNVVGTSSVGPAGMQTGFDVPDAVAGSSQAITAGSTWHFQVWHRDMRPSGATSNFSNGLSVTF